MAKSEKTASLNARIKDHLLSGIMAGRWKEGDRIPSESELCAQFSTSRMTANRAVKELTEQGYLVRTQGAGTFVAKPALSATMQEIRSIKQEIEATGATHRCRVLRLDRFALGSDLAADLGMPDGAQIVLLDALHTKDDRPIQFERRYVNPVVAPDFHAQEFTHSSASDYLLRTVAYTEADHQVSAVPADEEQAELLQIPIGAPCLRLLRRTDLNGALVTRVELVHPGSDFTLRGKLPLPNQILRDA